MILEGKITELKSRWEPYRDMWTHYWMKLLLIKSNDAWQLQVMHVLGRFSLDEPMRPTTIRTDSFFVTSRMISHETFAGILDALAIKSRFLIPGFPEPVSLITTDSHVSYSEGSRASIAQWTTDIREGCPLSVCELEWSGQLSPLGPDSLIDQLNLDAQKIGYEDFNELSEAQVQQSWNGSNRAVVNLSLPLGLKLESDLDAGKVRVCFRQPITSVQIEVFLVNDKRWSDDLAPVKVYVDPERLGWNRLRLDLKTVPTISTSELWVKYKGALDFPRSLKLAVGRSSKYGLEMINKFIYGSGFPKALRSGKEQLEVAVLNALAGLDLTAFYCGVHGRQVEGADIIVVDRDNRRAAVIEVTSQNYRSAIDDKRPVVAAAAQRLKILLPHDWTVYAVLALTTAPEKLDAAHRQSLRTADVVLMTQDDLDWLGSKEAAASDWWSKLYIESARPYDFFA